MPGLFSSQLVTSIRTLFRSAARTCRDFSRDPLAHPVLDGMSLTELADIPASELRARSRV